MFDIFYTGPKPGIAAFEKPADSLDQAAQLSRTEFFWYVHGNADYTGFDFTWQPPKWDDEYTHVFPSQWHSNGGVYFAHKDRANKGNLKFQSCQSIRRLANMDNWIVPANLDTTDFDFTWHPNPLEADYEYHFPTQWQKQGGPVYKGTSGIKYMPTQKAYITNATQIFYMDYMDPGSDEQFKELQQRYPAIKRTRYVSDHLNVLKRIMNLAETKFVWVISSICDYSLFDFTWHPEHFQEEMIHCFVNDSAVNNKELRGDTFYINVESFKAQMIELELLDWFNVINYVTAQTVKRKTVPAVLYNDDNLVAAIKNHTFTTPYALFTTDPGLLGLKNDTTCMWTEKDRLIRDCSVDKSTSLVPRDAKQYIKTQVYDYPYLNTEKERNVKWTPDLDIIYISNGEPDEKKWFEHTEYMSDRDVKWVKGINGRTAAYQEAARQSSTDWFFAVFAKLEVLGGNFNWHWQPDYWQEPKHYIFNSRNILNGLVYGHQGMIAYNKRLVLANNDPGIDFTLSQPHESVPILSGTAHFNQDPWMTWRTAFREVIKLKHFDATAPTVENSYRLKVWLTKAEGTNAEWCLKGAADALDYYESVNGDYNKLMFSFEWAWLRAYYDAKY